ncbi:MAG: insulinase family protein [Oscillatoriophycideae cyanobacterium NC_groundwater_1537_Pr4_S-0.65um_50_18]|nr:insulinase family protein [Oscillatoriophycideae cyanobacterium NC_groundwater_1537_Pr4_S-0.65um_50_18]
MAVLNLRLRPYLLVGLFFSFFLGIVVFSSFVPTVASTPATSPSSVSLTEGTQKTVLDNGLVVLTKEIHTAPVVSAQIWYRVGSRNEPAGQNGISHQLEHLMFKGTTDRPIQFGRFFSALGSQSNAFTSYDETAYFGTVESNKLEALLTLEADRMTHALMGAEQLASEKKVVISELQGYENNPGYRLGKEVMRTVFPDRSYGLPVGGTKSDVEQFTAEQVQAYYRTYYSPDNATLVITGDFDTQAALEQVRRLYGQIPKRAENRPSDFVPPGAEAMATPLQSSPIVMKQPGSAALLQAVYPLPDINHPDVPAIDLMDMVLTGGRSSRLYQALVETGLATGVGAYAAEMIEPGWYNMSATAAPGKDIAEVDRVLLEALAVLSEKGVTAEELDRAKTQLKTSFVLSNQDISSQASQLAFNQTVTGDYLYSDRYLAAIDQVTPAEVQRVAQIYLEPTKRTVGYFEPTVIDGQSGAGSSSNRAVESFNPGAPVDPAEVARYLPPIKPIANANAQPLPTQLKLENGLRVLLLPDAGTPMINLNGWINAGSSFDTTDKAGLASLTSDNLMNGTRSKDALTLAKTLENEGASLGFSARREGMNFSGYALPENLPTLIQTLADVMQNATFPADQLELTRQRAITRLKVELDDPQQLGWRVFREAVYPASHPYRSFATPSTLSAITQADVTSFYQQHYRPDNTIVTLVGRFDPEQVQALITENFGNWKAEGNKPTLNFPQVSLPASMTELTPVIPGKTEAVTYMGYYGGINRQDARFYAALVLNQILGGDTLSSRLGTEIRDRQGLTYGIYSFFQAGLEPGPFAIFMQTAPGDAPKAIDSTIALLKQMRQQGVTAAELDSAKRSLISGYSVDLADPSNLSASILDNDVLGLTPEEIRQYPEKLNAVTAEQVQQVIADLIHPDNLVIVTAGPGDGSPTGG